MPTDIMGAMEIAGDEMMGEEMVGATSPHHKQKLLHRTPDIGRDLVLGFDSVAAVAAAASQDITSQPQLVFRPDRLVVPATIAPSFLIADFRVGKNSQFLNSTGVPAEVFSQSAFGVRLKCDTAQVSNNITIRVTNFSAGALRFFCALIGPSVQ